MLIVSTREFRANQKAFLDKVDCGTEIMLQRKNKAYKIVPVGKNDTLLNIPPEYRCNPYEVSSSGDVFWADKRNVEQLEKDIEQAHEDFAEGKVKNFNSAQEAINYFENL